MVKIIINSCYGGFRLSPKGFKKYLEKKGKNAYFYTGESPGYFDKLKRAALDELKNQSFSFYHVITKDFGHYISREEFNEKVSEEDFLSSREIERDDPDLIEVVKELGDEANSVHSKLKIVEIPDDVEWTIEEYDGVEWVAEKHKTWR